jgi:rSAM/selenodomain-associated transferase 2
VTPHRPDPADLALVDQDRSPNPAGQPWLSIVVPVLDEAAGIAAALHALQPLRGRGAQVIVVDGGSTDGTAAIAAPLADAVLAASRGRALQMNAGAAHAQGAVLLFLHADTALPEQADALVRRAIDAGSVWGRFDVRIAGRHPMLRVVAALINLRSRATRIATGDQAIFVQRELFERLGGFAPIPLMEDIELSRRLGRAGRPACLRPPAVTSGRRWESRGVWRTILLMWRLRWRYWRGESPARLAEAYR